MMILSANELE